MTLELFTGAAREWDAFVGAQPAATSSHLYGWRGVIERVYQHDCPYLAVRNEQGALAGVLPLVDVRSVWFGRSLVSMPYLNAGGPLGSPTAVQHLTDGAVELARTRRAAVLELRCNTPLDINLRAATEKISCVLPLPEDPQALWRAFPGKLRSQIRRSQKENIELRFGPEQREPFFTVFERNMRDLGSPVHHPRFFAAMAEKLASHVWFGCAYHGARPVAAGCALEFGDEIEMTWASSLREFNALAPNMLLYWSFMERAAALGFRKFNFGRCTPNSGTHRFKQQWGALDTELHWYRSPASRRSALPTHNRRTAIATRIWQRLPVSVATGVGSRVRGGIPA